MVQIDLAGTWKMKAAKDTEWMEGTVPGSVFHDLLKAGKIRDPFYRDNEKQAIDVAACDYEYQRTFEVSRHLLENDKIFLRCEGLDTLAEIRVNGTLLATTDNMHRTYEFDVHSLLKEGGNAIRITFRSPLPLIERKNKELPLWGVEEAVPGYPHIRKAHYMFGWDWGPQIPDAGIWRAISIVAYNDGRLDDVYIEQKHQSNCVSLDVSVGYEQWADRQLQVEVHVKPPDGETLIEKGKAADSKISLDIPNPQIWWPAGYGKQPLYEVTVLLKDGEKVLDHKALKIGLRTIRLKQEKDQWGESFAFEVNGIAIFAKGSNYIPEDNMLGRRDPRKTETLIQDCVEANFNMLRVWGGGFYPDDSFYDLCDRYGLLVWQDFMFACGVYRMTEAFASNIEKEAEDNVKRIRHHASLALWCGNNEMETAWVDWGFPKTGALREDYLKQFEDLLPRVVQKHDPQTPYWPSSPSSGGGFERPNDENRGDVHYWNVWHGLKPFTEYRKFHYRFVSEFGFQSFPSLKTVSSFTEPEDRNIFSYVMERHQKNESANGIILYYLSQNFRYPKDFASLLYTSQILQAEAIKYGVEHWRRERGRCMGTTYWQLNDCWPVASWSGIDSFGRWKALHYFAKKFYAPVLLSAREEGTDIALHITNDKTKAVEGTITWRLCDQKSSVVREGKERVKVDPLNSLLISNLDFSDAVNAENERNTYLEYTLLDNEEQVSEGTVLFCKAKHFDFIDPKIRTEVKESDDHYSVLLQSSAFAKYVELELADDNGHFSDNFFDLPAGAAKTVEILKSSLSSPLSADQLKDQLRVRSIYDIV